MTVSWTVSHTVISRVICRLWHWHLTECDPRCRECGLFRRVLPATSWRPRRNECRLPHAEMSDSFPPCHKAYQHQCLYLQFYYLEECRIYNYITQADNYACQPHQSSHSTAGSDLRLQQVVGGRNFILVENLRATVDLAIQYQLVAVKMYFSLMVMRSATSRQ